MSQGLGTMPRPSRPECKPLHPASVTPSADEPFGISVVVVNWNAKADLASCLESLEQQTDRDFETIVVDNGSTDGSLELLRTRFRSVRVIANGTNLGFAEGCNRGIEIARKPWIATLNNDAVAAPRWISELRTAARFDDPRLGMLQSRILFKHKRDRLNSTGLVVFSDGGAMDREYDQPDRDSSAVEEIFCPSAGAALYRRTMLDEVRLPSGFFDRNYFMYVEDADLGWRARLAGWRSVYVPNAVVHHAFQGSARRRERHFVELHCKRNRLRTLVKNGSRAFLMRTAWRTAIDVWDSVWWEGLSAIPAFIRAASDAAVQRAEVSRIARLDRRDVERRWVEPER